MKNRTSKDETYSLRPLAQERAVAILTESLATQAKHLVAVRAQGREMIACLVARANLASVRVCRSLGIDIPRGATGVFGLVGADAARLFAHLPAEQRSWLETPCAPRETKVLLIA